MNIYDFFIFEIVKAQVVVSPKYPETVRNRSDKYLYVNKNGEMLYYVINPATSDSSQLVENWAAALRNCRTAIIVIVDALI